MLDVGNLLGQMMGSGMSGSAQNRVNHALGPQGMGQQGNPLAGLLGGGTGGGGAGGGGAGGMLGGLADVAQNMLQGAGGAVRQNNPLAIGGLGALAGGLFDGGSGALKGGAMALLGSLAFSAMRNWGGSGGGGGGGVGGSTAAPASADDLAREAPLGVRAPQTPAEEEELQHNALLALRAMISAAKADGTIDLSEMQRIIGRLQEAGADDEARAFVDAEMQKPLDLDGLIRDVRSPESAVEVYAASLLAIEVDTPAERDYLQRLAAGLGLEANTVNYIHETLGVTV